MQSSRGQWFQRKPLEVLVQRATGQETLRGRKERGRRREKRKETEQRERGRREKESEGEAAAF